MLEPLDLLLLPMMISSKGIKFTLAILVLSQSWLYFRNIRDLGVLFAVEATEGFLA